jgi:hypothetical protein
MGPHDFGQQEGQGVIRAHLKQFLDGLVGGDLGILRLARHEPNLSPIERMSNSFYAQFAAPLRSRF